MNELGWVETSGGGNWVVKWSLGLTIFEFIF
jgi:hypothetical protein